MSRDERFLPVRQWLQMVFLVLVAAAVAVTAIPCPAHAEDLDKLASETQKQIKGAENKMFSGKNEEAAALLDDAARKIDSLKSAAPDHRMLRSLETSYERTRKTLERKLGTPPPQGKKTAASPSAAAGPAQGKTPPAEAGQADKLPGGVSKRVKDVGQILDNVERHLESGGSAQQARYQLERAAETFAEIDRQYGGKFSPEHPDFENAQARYAKVEEQVKGAEERESAGKAQAAETKAAMEAQSAEWVQKFTPYVANPAREGHDPAKYLVYPGTSDPQALARMQKIHDELAALFAEYQKIGFPDGKTWQLEQAEGEVKSALENFSNSLAEGTQGAVAQAESNLDQALAQLNRQEWKADPAATPPIVDRDWAKRIQGMVAQAEQILPASDPKLAGLKTKQQEMIRLDEEHRKAWAERTFMRPEIYKGKDLPEVRKAAEKIVTTKIPGARILRVSVYKDDWQEEAVLEHTDTTRTAVRHRVTRMINAQVAAKEGEVVKLHTLHIARDKQAEGWGGLYGNIMSSDLMLEKNVDKDGP